jgi:hypothetical protein
MNTIEDCEGQLAAVEGFFGALGELMDRLPAPSAGVREEEVV